MKRPSHLVLVLSKLVAFLNLFWFYACSGADDEVAAEARRALTREMWRDRLQGVQRNHEVWQVSL